MAWEAYRSEEFSTRRCQESLLQYQGWSLAGLPHRKLALFSRGRTPGKTTEHVDNATGAKCQLPSVGAVGHEDLDRGQRAFSELSPTQESKSLLRYPRTINTPAHASKGNPANHSTERHRLRSSHRRNGDVLPCSRARHSERVGEIRGTPNPYGDRRRRNRRRSALTKRPWCW